MFERDVSILGTTYTRHGATAIEHLLRRGITVIHSESFGRAGTTTRRHERELDDSMGFEAAEAWLQEIPDFAEAVDPAEQAAQELEAALASVLGLLTDEQAEAVMAMYPEWASGVGYGQGQRVRFGGSLWRCVQAHESQAGWEPGVAASLWSRTSAESEDGDPATVPEWVQPTGAHDAYSAGDRVTHGGQVWESAIDANVYEPGAYGWEVVA